jgi:hypothetical protein
MKPGTEALAQAYALATHLNSLLRTGQDRTGDRRRLDADETNMLALALEQLRTRVYEAEYPELKGRMLVAVDSDIDSAAESFAYEETDEVGKARVITNYADDFPTVETKSGKITYPVISLGDAYTYSIMDLRRAAFTGRPLEARKAMAARRAYERGLDDLIAFGSAADGIPDGICNRAVGTGAGQIRSTAMTAASWDSTPDALGMVADLNKAVAEMIADSRELHSPDTLVLPTLQFLRLSQTFTTDNKPESAKDRFLSSNGFVRQVVSWDLLRAVDGASGNYSRGILMRKDADVHSVVIPQEFEVFAPQPKNLAFQVLCHGRTAGWIVYRPLGLRYLTGLPNT